MFIDICITKISLQLSPEECISIFRMPTSEGLAKMYMNVGNIIAHLFAFVNSSNEFNLLYSMFYFL